MPAELIRANSRSKKRYPNPEKSTTDASNMSPITSMRFVRTKRYSRPDTPAPDPGLVLTAATIDLTPFRV